MPFVLRIQSSRHANGTEKFWLIVTADGCKMGLEERVVKSHIMSNEDGSIHEAVKIFCDVFKVRCTEKLTIVYTREAFDPDRDGASGIYEALIFLDYLAILYPNNADLNNAASFSAPSICLDIYKHCWLIEHTLFTILQLSKGVVISASLSVVDRAATSLYIVIVNSTQLEGNHRGT